MLAVCWKALKEWDTICRALATGHQILTLRAGGLREEGGTFEVQENEFFLFPTFSHQKKEDVIEEFWVEPQQEEKSITIEAYARVHDVFPVTDKAILQQLAKETIWKPESLEERFAMAEGTLIGLVLRVYRLAVYRFIEVKSKYAGCKSWVDLEEPIPTIGARPVLTDEEFGKKRERILAIIKEMKGASYGETIQETSA